MPIIEKKSGLIFNHRLTLSTLGVEELKKIKSQIVIRLMSEQAVNGNYVRMVALLNIILPCSH